MRQEEVKGRLAQLAVELKGTVVADGTVDERNAGGQEQHQEDQVHAGEAGHNAQGGEGAGGSREAGRSAVGQPQSYGARQGRPEEDGQQVRSQQPPSMLPLEGVRGATGAAANLGTGRKKLCVHVFRVALMPIILL